MARALCLNATYEPLGFIPMDRAVAIYLDEKVDILETTGRMLRSKHLSVPEPLVIKLRQYKRVPRAVKESITPRVLFARDDWMCQYCETPASKLKGKNNRLTIDHIKPKSQGGPHHWENVVTACYRCNLKKRNRTPMQANMPLRGKYKNRSPKKPHLLVFTWGGRINQVQERYIKQFYGVDSLNEEVDF